MTARLHRTPSGFTLIELVVGLAIAVILLVTAVPSFVQAFATMRLEGAASELATDLQLARTESVRRRRAVVLTFDADGKGYAMAASAPSACADCTTIKSVTLPGGVSAATAGTLGYEPLRGHASVASATLSTSGAPAQLRVATDAVGRVQLCSPSGTHRSYTRC